MYTVQRFIQPLVFTLIIGLVSFVLWKVSILYPVILKFISIPGYILIVLFSIISFVSGRVHPEAAGFLGICYIIGLFYTIFYILVSVQNKSVHILCFSVLVLFIPYFIGIKATEIKKNEEAKEYILGIVEKIDEYKCSNEIEMLNEHDIENIHLSKHTQLKSLSDPPLFDVYLISSPYIELFPDGVYRLYYKNLMYNSENKKFRRFVLKPNVNSRM